MSDELLPVSGAVGSSKLAGATIAEPGALAAGNCDVVALPLLATPPSALAAGSRFNELSLGAPERLPGDEPPPTVLPLSFHEGCEWESSVPAPNEPPEWG